MKLSRSLACAAVTLTAALGLAAPSAFALNPQPLPPGADVVALNPQPLPPLNPQPLPPFRPE
ncbi:MAG TPA: hypothetical protein VMA77_18715 [Solirubrobacteraceae bacterium]|nr:hypothetical protein [Solirubrobacteraceae bacterium]